MLAPIAIFAFNRPTHLNKTILSLLKCKEALESEVYFFCDGPKKETDKEAIDEIQELLKNVKGFNKVQIIQSKTNLGLANSIIQGVSKILEKEEKIIVLEDDMIVSEDFLSFMNDCLNTYNNSKIIQSISGYCYPITIPNTYKHDVCLLPRASSWGWGTWKSKWIEVDWELKNINDFLKNKELKKSFRNGGDDLITMLFNQVNNKIDSWAIRWTYDHWKNKSYCLQPINSKVQNIGTDGSGTHFKKSIQTNPLVNSSYKLNAEILPNTEILDNLKKYFAYSFIKKLKYKLKKIV